MYLNLYVPGLQREEGVACFFRFHRGNQLNGHEYAKRQLAQKESGLKLSTMAF